MCMKIDQALEMYNKACQAELEGKIILAEVYYLKSWSLFEQVGGVHTLNAANALNGLALLRRSRGDVEGARRSIKQSICLMEIYGSQFPGADADLIKATAWDLMHSLNSYDVPAQEFLRIAG